MIRQLICKGRKNNKGAALITVIVVVTFMSILATIVLFAAGNNFNMKATDQANKESFYDGEKALEEIKAALMLDAQKAFEEAYKKSMSNYAQDMDSTTRQNNFNKEYVKQYEDLWNKHLVDYGSAQNYLSAQVDSEFSGCITYDITSHPSETIIIEETDGKVTIGTVSFEYTNTAGYLTKISTEYVIAAPKSCWGGVPSDPSLIMDKNNIIGTVNYKNWTKK